MGSLARVPELVVDIGVRNADIRRRPAEGSCNAGELRMEADEVPSSVDLRGERGGEGEPVLSASGEIGAETRKHQIWGMMRALKGVMETAEAD